MPINYEEEALETCNLTSKDFQLKAQTTTF